MSVSAMELVLVPAVELSRGACSAPPSLLGLLVKYILLIEGSLFSAPSLLGLLAK